MAIHFRSEARRVSRTILALPVQLLSAGEASIHGDSIDLSENGMGVFAPDALVPGQDCMLAMSLPDDRKVRRINLLGKVVYCHLMDGGYRIGVRFVDMDARSRDCIRCLALDLLTCFQACGRKM